MEDKRHCSKCRIPIICECGCISFKERELKSKIAKKQINYTICGESCRAGIKEKCVNCGTSFVIKH